MKQNVGKWERLASLAAGAGLLYFTRHRMRGRALTRTLGGALLFRGASGYCPISAAAGRSTAGTTDTREALGGSRGVHVRETVIIDRPVAEVFEHWRNLENLPRFMQHLERVQMFADGRSHWVARGPAGMQVEWDAETINIVPNQLIGWRSLERADVVSAGSVNFREVGAGSTEVRVHLQYEPPAGRVGSWVASLLGSNPSRQIREDLQRLKRSLEERGRQMTEPRAAATLHAIGPAGLEHPAG